jgi:hypothetical protein
MKGSTQILETERQLSEILRGLLNDKEPRESYHIQGVLYTREALIELLRERHNRYARVRLGRAQLSTWIADRDHVHGPTRKFLSDLHASFQMAYGPTNPKLVEMGVPMQKKRKKYRRRKQ